MNGGGTLCTTEKGNKSVTLERNLREQSTFLFGLVVSAMLTPAAPRVAPFPWLAVGIILFVAAGDVLMDVMLYPILPYLVADSGVPADRIGVEVGLLGSAYALAQAVTLPLWGRLSDNIGRRPVLIFGQCALITSTLILGFGSRYLCFAPPHPFLPYVAPDFSHISPFILVFLSFAPPTHFSHMSHPTFPISHL